MDEKLKMGIPNSLFNACSNGAMTFGDINDKESEIAQLKEDDRMYHFWSVGTKPNVMYHTKVRNTEYKNYRNQ